MVAQVNAEGFFTGRPAVGTRVKLEGCPGIWASKVRDQSGEVIQPPEDGIVMVRFDNGRTDFGEWRYLKPETPAADAPAPEITLNGHRYVLAGTPAPEVKEEQRKPRQGEIWRDGPDALYLVARIGEGTGYLCAINLKSANRYSDTEFDGNGMNYAYPSLTAAIEAGKKFT